LYVKFLGFHNIVDAPITLNVVPLAGDFIFYEV